MPIFLFRNTATNALVRVVGETPLDVRTVLPDGQWEVAVASDWAETTLTVASPTHVFLIAGQSNSISRANFDGGADWPAGVRQYGRFAANNGQLVPAARPLEHHDRPVAGGMGWALQFSIDYLAANPGVSLVFVPAGAGGTGFSNNRWNPGNDLFVDAVSRTNALMTAHPEFVFQGILWQQGEADSGSTQEALSHAAALDAMIAGMRTAIQAADARTPVVLGGMVPSWVAQLSSRQLVQAGIEDTPNRVAHCAHVSSAGLNASDGIHFDAASMRLLGSRYVDALAVAEQNVTAGWSINNATIQSYIDVPAPQVSGAVVIGGA